MMFTMQEPYYGIILSAMERVAVPAHRCDTMGVTRAGNVFRLLYNEDFVNSLDSETLLQCLKHEVLHLAFNHFDIWKDKHPTSTEQRIRNIAADMEVNSYVDVSKMSGVNPVTASFYGWKNELGTREYYNRLKQKEQDKQEEKKQKCAGDPEDKPCDGGQSMQQSAPQENEDEKEDNNEPEESNNTGDAIENESSSSTSNNTPRQQQAQGHSESNNNKDIDDKEDDFDGLESWDDHSEWPDEGQNSADLEQMIDDILVFAAEEVEKSRGTIPGELVGKIGDIRNRRKPKPVADWKRYVRRYLGNEFSEFMRKSKKRESRRFPDAAGNKHRRKSHILVAIDTSGSVSMPEYIEFFGQIKTLSQVATFHIVECDTIIQHEYDYRGRPNMTLHGGGGTSFQPVIDLYNKDKRKYDALVYFTDGYCDIPKDTPKDTLWIISSKGDKRKEKYTINGASVAFIPNQD